MGDVQAAAIARFRCATPQCRRWEERLAVHGKPQNGRLRAVAILVIGPQVQAARIHSWETAQTLVLCGDPSTVELSDKQGENIRLRAVRADSRLFFHAWRTCMQHTSSARIARAPH